MPMRKPLITLILELIEEIERRTKHDVKAKIEAFCQVAGGYEYVHLGYDEPRSHG